MAQDFFEQLRGYYRRVAESLGADSGAASALPNPTDKGANREHVYADFLKQHAPSKCVVSFGGYLFDEHGATSKQLDILITTDTAPRYDLNNLDGSRKT